MLFRSHQRGPLVVYLNTAIAYEKGEMQQCLAALGKLRVNAGQLYEIYRQAIRFATLID